MDKLKIKQAIVVRNDLRSKLRHGKLASQVSHASMAAFLDGMKIEPKHSSCFHLLTLEMEHARTEWISNSFTKIILRCDDEDSILRLNDECIKGRYPHALITDAGRTVFQEPTITCLGIGPLPEEILYPLTGHLKLY